MMEETIGLYKKYRRRNRLFLAVLLLLLLLAAGVALLAGAHRIGGREWLSLLFGAGEEMNRRILLHLRLPRMLAAVAVGTMLSVAGAVMQVLLRNPLASPYTLGISNAAAFGASVGIVCLGTATALPYAVTLSAFFGSLVGLGVILLLVRVGRASVETMILAGVIINSLFGAGIAVMQYLADHVQLASIVFWTFGDLGRGDWYNLVPQALVLLPALLYFHARRWDYKALSAGDDYAVSLGVHPRRLRVAGLVVTSLCTAVAVSFFGVIAFVGLVVPHIVRKCVGDNEEFLLPASALFGGGFLLLCDTAARTLLAPVILPVGILTSFLGVPLFLFLLIRKK